MAAVEQRTQIIARGCPGRLMQWNRKYHHPAGACITSSIALLVEPPDDISTLIQSPLLSPEVSITTARLQPRRNIFRQRGTGNMVRVLFSFLSWNRQE